MKKIGVLDCNNFFVSCELLFRPDLLNKPVVVLSGKNGCVVTRSQEIKDMSIPVGVPYFQIKDILQNKKTEIFFTNRALYKDISRRVFEVVKSEIEDIELYSIDECFFLLKGDIDNKVNNLKKIVERGVGIPVSIGVADSKTQAKYVNSIAKKTKKVEVWNSEDWRQRASEVSLSEIWGVGFNRSRKLMDFGIKTVNDLCQMNESDCHKSFGVFGVRLRGELSGRAVFNIETTKQSPQSLTSSRSLVSATHNVVEIENNIKYHLNKMVLELEVKGLLASSLKVFVLPGRYSDFVTGINQEILLDKPTDNLFTLQKMALSILSKYYQSDVPYKKIGVVLSELISGEFSTGKLFEDKADFTDDVSKLIVSINKNYGNSALRLGGVSGGMNLNFANKSHSPRYTTNWNELPIVKT